MMWKSLRKPVLGKGWERDGKKLKECLTGYLIVTLEELVCRYPY